MLNNNQRFSIKTIIACLLILVTFSANASFEKAMEVYISGRFTEAKDAFEVLSAIGDRASLFNLGVMYYRGEAVEADPARAYALMKIANEDLEDENFTKTSDIIFSRLSDDQVKQAQLLYEELNAVYAIKKIKENIFPQLLDDKDCPPEVLPIKRNPPKYPKSELNNGNMGLVYAELTISPEGYPRDIKITSSTSRAFTKATKKAIKSFQYEPILTGIPKMGHRFVLIYQIDYRAGTKLQTKGIIRELNTLKDESESGDVVAQYFYARNINAYRRFQNLIKDVDFQYREENKWLIKSANGGLVNAQYEIGRNMLEGKGCEVDKENGFKWINAAAIGGYMPAQSYLASSKLSDSIRTKQSSRAAISWLRNAIQDDDYSSKVMLAWELVTSLEESFLNPDEALSLLENTPYTYSDELRIIETKAAAHARKGDYKKAIKIQEKAVELAEDKEWSIPKLAKRLDTYMQYKPYYGAYY